MYGITPYPPSSNFHFVNSNLYSSKDHIKHLTGAAAPPQIRNAILYLTMRFAKTIKQITAVQAYYAGDRVSVEIDLVVDEEMGLRDSHDLGESLQYVVESLPVVERALWVLRSLPRFYPFCWLWDGIFSIVYI